MREHGFHGELEKPIVILKMKIRSSRIGDWLERIDEAVGVLLHMADVEGLSWISSTLSHPIPRRRGIRIGREARCESIYEVRKRRKMPIE